LCNKRENKRLNICVIYWEPIAIFLKARTNQSLYGRVDIPKPRFEIAFAKYPQ
jgi:hypothetical protein